MVNNLHYTDFLLIKKNSFFIRLITCPICLGVWLNVGCGVLFGFEDFFIKFFLSTSLYYIYSILLNESYAD